MAPAPDWVRCWGETMSIGVTAPPVRLVRVGLGPAWFTRLAVSAGVVSAAVLGFALARPSMRPIRVVAPRSRRSSRLRRSAPPAYWWRISSGVAGCPTCCSCAPSSPWRSPILFSRRARSYRWDEGRIWRRRQTCLRADRRGYIRRGVRTGQVDQVSRRRLIGVAALAGAATVIVAELLEEATGSRWSASLQEIGIRGAVAHRVKLAVNGVAAIVLLVSGLAFLRRAQRGAARCALLAGASFLLAGARLQYLAIPAVATNWITPREGLRLAAYAMLLASAYWEYARAHGAEAVAAISSERERIARELHDGLAQDLACIAAQSQRLGVELQREHPLMVAARNALATSRGVIADLSASTAPTTEAALRLIADDLHHRHGLEIEVRVEMTRAWWEQRLGSRGPRARRADRSRGNRERGAPRPGPACRRGLVGYGRRRPCHAHHR